MFNCNEKRLALAAFSAVALAACGGGGGDAAGSAGLAPPTATATRSTGVVNGFGSVIVDGVRYRTDDAEFEIEGRFGFEDELRVGYIVEVTGSVDPDGRSGTARRVRYDDIVEGPVDSIDRPAGILVVAGQTVVTGPETLYDDDLRGADLDAIEVGDAVEVSGFFDADDRIRATRIELDDDDDGEVEVEGRIADLDGVAGTFRINALTVDYRSVPALLDDIGSGGLADGLRVEVEGRRFDTEGRLLADEVEGRRRGWRDDDDDDDDDNDDAGRRFQGVITAVLSDTDIEVSGRPVRLSSTTRFADDDRGCLVVNASVAVRGRIGSDDVLDASFVDCQRRAGIEVESFVENVDAAAGTVRLIGIEFTVTERTRFEDDSDQDLRRFSLADVRTGDFLEISAYRDAEGRLVATKVEREDDDNESEIDAVIEGFDAAGSSFTLLGVEIRTDGSTEFDDFGGRAAFFAVDRTGERVEVEGMVIADGVLLADEVDRDDRDDWDDWDGDGRDDDFDDDDDDDDDDGDDDGDDFGDDDDDNDDDD